MKKLTRGQMAALVAAVEQQPEVQQSPTLQRAIHKLKDGLAFTAPTRKTSAKEETK